jgi:SdrD B-like domain/SprB repeat
MGKNNIFIFFECHKILIFGFLMRLKIITFGSLFRIIFTKTITMRKYLLNVLSHIVIILLLIVTVAPLNAQVSGRVFQDFNANGTFNSTATYKEVGQYGVIVNAYDPNNILLSTTYTGGGSTTNNTGEYAVTGGTLGQIRLEFILPDGFTFASNGENGGTTVMFPTTATQDLAVNYPTDFCNTSPSVASTTYVSVPGTNGTNGLSTFPYGNTGANAPGKLDLNSPYSTIGSVWGMTYQRETNTLFSSAFMKRHTAFGTGGTGAIYMTTNTNTPASSATSLYIDLQTLAGISTGTNPHSTDLSTDANNANGSPYDAVGKISLGDLDISADGKYLYTVSLSDKKIYSINIGNPLKPAASLTAADVIAWSIPDPCDAAKGTARPWGLGYSRGKLYVGVVCDASTSLTKNDLSATVYELDPTTGIFTTVLNFPLDFLRGAASSTPTSREYWEPWRSADYKNPTSTSYGQVNPQPVLSDIDFDNDGSMILAFLDRYSHQVRWGGGDQNGVGNFDPRLAGDILRAGKCGTNNTWTIENNASICGGTPTAGAGNTQGPGGGEYYFGEQYANNHLENSQGSVTMLRGANQVLLSVMDPVNIYSAGYTYLNNVTGTAEGKYEMVPSSSNPFGKAAAVGDLEVLCNAAPIEIGNRVFMDTDNDGEQDAGEMGVEGIKIELWKAGVKVTETITANGGQWFFRNLDADTDYEIKILAADIPTGKEITTTDGSTNDLIDNDAKMVGTDVVITYKTGSAGQNNHSLDFGFKTCILSTTATTTNPTCANNDGTIDITVTGATGTPTYIWSNGAATEDLTVISAGDYTVTVTAGSCSTTATYSISVTPINQVYKTCVGQNVELEITNNSLTNIKWYKDGIEIVGETGLKIIVTQVGVYTYTSNGIGGCAVGQCCPIEIQQMPMTIGIIGTSVTCNAGTNGEADLTVSGGTGTKTYVWSNGEITEDITNLTAGTYAVTVSDANSCTATASVTITEPSALTANIIGKNTTCNGGANGEADLTVSGGTGAKTYLWSNSDTTEDLANLAAGTYTVTVSDANNCTAKASVTITEPSALTANIIGTNVTCNAGANGEADLTVSGSTGTKTYLWNNGDTTEDLANLAAGTYNVTVTDANSCTATASVMVNEPAEILVGTDTANEGSCNGLDLNNDATITFSGVLNAQKVDKVLGSSYTSGPNFGDASNVAANTGSFQLTGLKHGTTYTVRIWQAVDCYKDVVVTTPTKTCCKPVICTNVKITKL